MRAQTVKRTGLRTLACGLGVAAAIAGGSVSGQAQFDLCGCEDPGRPLTILDSNDPTTLPPGSSVSCDDPGRRGNIFIRLPDDGVLVYDDVRIGSTSSWCFNWPPWIFFSRNARNTPVTLLVAGDAVFSRGNLYANGSAGVDGNTQPTPGLGGSPGPGGYRGGDGAWLDVKGVGDGGAGLGPRGGTAGLDGSPDDVTAGAGGYGYFPGADTLLPLIGGSGGGGGPSLSSGTCAGGGGGGGGGAILVIANGTMSFDGNFTIHADGGDNGDGYGALAGCGKRGGSGSGGAIRLVAHTVSGNANLYARGGGADNDPNPGVIRIEAINDTLGGDHRPQALRPGRVSPVANPLASWVRIAEVDGQPVPFALSGPGGGMDIIVPGPGLVPIQVETGGVPVGTTVQLTVKPKVGGAAIVVADELIGSSCPQGTGECSQEFKVDLDGGAYFVEALATFELP